MAFGLGLLNGLRYTFGRVLKTYAGDFRHLGRRYDAKEFTRRQSVRGDGIITVQYPEEKLPVPENFRFVPFLVCRSVAVRPTISLATRPQISPARIPVSIANRNATATR